MVSDNKTVTPVNSILTPRVIFVTLGDQSLKGY